MASHLIIGSSSNALKLAQTISPQKLVNGPDCFMLEDSLESLKIDQVRDIKHFLTRKPYQEDSVVVFIPTAHRLTIPAQNALLKTLEEPPEFAVLILTTPYEDRLLPTIISRCIMHYAGTNNNRNPANDTVALVFEQLKEANVGAKIAICQQYANTKIAGLELCKSLIEQSRTKLYEEHDYKHAKNMALAQQTITRLEQNVDPRLSLEHLFLNLLV